ncbi:hypothetical protein BDA99DRAFT_428845 [Phascolomyces articulosus]|uniref:V-SNARE coiled-coil homology domain-containing protein n=1 Tax=Phascolomyces articulosus TaxID=60185 RepID=A0AAD5PJL7_9FUNG|nr:hypothetical protein BDA99DRAFT_428845 [Phascolomyces articulosus]
MPPIPTSEEPNELNSPVSNTGSKRVTAGRWEYNQQPNPHFLVVVSTKSVATFLSGYNTRLFQNDLQSTQGCTEQDVIVGSKIMKADEGSNGTCLCVVLQGGNVIFYSLPHLNPIAKITLPADVVANRRLDDMSLSADGRMVVWSAPFELDQYLVLLQTNLPHGEAVVLHNPSIRMPPHPVQETAAQKPKKSWLDTVQSAFQKGPLTVTEFDKITAQSSSSAGGSGGSNTAKAQEESSGVGGVFKELGMKMNERGERLSELETKFEDMNQASGDFLKAVRDYNERQARKKWWEL